MTEQELRKKVAETAQRFVGTVQGSVKHKDLIDIYNGYKPRPRGHKLTYIEPWCAGFVSSISIQCGVTEIMPVECSCGQMVGLYKELGRWVEDDTYAPKVGDVIFYYWDDPANYKSTDQTGGPNHTGIVVELQGKSFVVVEGNRIINNVSQVAYRTMDINGRYIRGYGCPDYASKVARPWYAEAMDWAKSMELMDGTRPNDYATRAEIATIAKRLYDLTN